MNKTLIVQAQNCHQHLISPLHMHTFLFLLSAPEDSIVAFKASISSSDDHCQFIHVLG